MTPTGQTLCLCMIVKNEAHVIRRCLASVRPIIDHWIIVDTGSSDGTQDIVREAMAGIPGEVVERPWVDFAHNRTEALELARPHGSYSLIIDADDALDLARGFTLPDLTADSYTIDIFDNGTTYRRTQAVRNALAWRYRGVLHEFLECSEAKTVDHLPILMRRKREGARSTDPQTYAKDAVILEQALTEETDPFLISRYTFYLAQSYRDCGNHEAALKHYLRRAELGFWIEEVYVSLFQAGQMMEALKRNPDEIIATWERASATVPTRAEAAHAASKLCRLLGRHEQGYALAKPFVGLSAPSNGLFVQTWAYDYALFDEFAVNAYWSGNYRDCLDASLRAAQSGKVPPHEMPRFLANMRFALNKIETHPLSLLEARSGNEHFSRKSPGVTATRLAILIPFRDREAHLAKFLPHVISYFNRDKADKNLEITIVVCEQADRLPFNRGGLLNAGFLAVENSIDYVCFHDVDYLPMWADYSLPENPKRIIWWGMHKRPLRVNDSRRWVTASVQGLGAVCLFRKEHFRRINGFSNNYYGWGFEDSDIEYRCRLLGLEVGYREGTFIPLDHDNLGFKDDGSKSDVWIENEARFAKSKNDYSNGSIKEGLSSFDGVTVGEQFETYVGLEAPEVWAIKRIFVSFDKNKNSRVSVNLALRKRATQSSICEWSTEDSIDKEARRGNNGIINDEEYIHTDIEENPWWQVYLECRTVIHKVVIHNRREQAHRLQHFSILGYVDNNHWSVLYRKTDDRVFGDRDRAPHVVFVESKQEVNIVRIQVDGRNYLHFSEIQVYGRDIERLK